MPSSFLSSKNLLHIKIFLFFFLMDVRNSQKMLDIFYVQKCWYPFHKLFRCLQNLSHQFIPEIVFHIFFCATLNLFPQYCFRISISALYTITGITGYLEIFLSSKSTSLMLYTSLDALQTTNSMKKSISFPLSIYVFLYSFKFLTSLASMLF